MFGSTFVRVVATLLLVALIAVIGVNVYNAGVAEGLAEAARAAAAAGEDPAVVVPPYVGPYGGYGPGWGYGWGGGFGIFGLLFFILGVFLIFALLRAAFGWGRLGGPRGPGGSSWQDERRRRLEEFHRDLHHADEPGVSPGG
jgi:hypothetical protein